MVEIDCPDRSNFDFVIKTGNTEPAITSQLLDENDEPVDLTNASVRFRMRKPGASNLAVDSSASITNASEGRVRYLWSESDTSDADYYNAAFVVDYSGDTGSNFDADEEFPNNQYLSIKVEEAI